jgi:hypothetical protein
MMTDMEQLVKDLSAHLAEVNQDLVMADGADSDYNYLVGVSESYEAIINYIKEG